MTTDKPLFRIEMDAEYPTATRGKIYCMHPKIMRTGTTDGVKYHCHNLQMCGKEFEPAEVATRDNGKTWELAE